MKKINNLLLSAILAILVCAVPSFAASDLYTVIDALASGGGDVTANITPATPARRVIIETIFATADSAETVTLETSSDGESWTHLGAFAVSTDNIVTLGAYDKPLAVINSGLYFRAYQSPDGAGMIGVNYRYE